MKILGIETSCDETAAAVVESRRGKLSVLSNVVASQVKLHAKTGGVVPEVAARSHVETIIPVVGEAIRKAGLKPQTPNLKPQLDAIAVTVGPGLITSLRVGVDTARTLAAAWNVPVVAVNHLEGHIYANWLPSLNLRRSILDPIQFPMLVLIVSGGHTELVLMRKHLDYEMIGATRDDAAGEAFDKVAKILGLGYPGGPAVSKLAEKGNPQAIDFPRPMLNSKDFDFSFSGLKTAVLYKLRSLQPTSYNLQANTCASFEQAIVDVLIAKTIRAAKKYKVKTVLLGGGVAANKKLRAELAKAVKTLQPTTYLPTSERNLELAPRLPSEVGRQRAQRSYYLQPSLQYTTDNAAMIAAAGAIRASKKQFTPWQKLGVDPNLELCHKKS